VVVDYVAERPLKLRQWTGYDPPPDAKYLASIKSSGIPPQWHVEASSTDPAAEAFTLTVLRVYRRGRMPASQVGVERGPSSLGIRVVGSEQKEVAITFQKTAAKDFAVIRRDGREWKVGAVE
jgi:hypothetical protein